MATPVLVVTNAPGFGELIQITLENEGRYEVVWADRGEKALKQARAIPFEVAILDAEVEDVPLSQLAQGLRQSLHGLNVIVVPPNNDPSHPVLAGVDVQGCLTKPFYVPDLTRMVNQIVSDSARTAFPPVREPVRAVYPDTPHSSTKESHAPTWLDDVNRAAQHLTRLSLESAAQAALLVRANQLWAYAGQLPQSAVQELVEFLVNHKGGNDLARFIHLRSTETDYMLYAIGLSSEMALALAFDAHTPFTKMRAQAASLAKALASPPAVELSQVVTLPAVDNIGMPRLPIDDDIPILDLGDVPPPLPHHGKRPKKHSLSFPEYEETPEAPALPVGLSPAFNLDALPAVLPADVAPVHPAEVAPTLPEEWVSAEEGEIHPTLIVAPPKNETISLPPVLPAENPAPHIEPSSPTVVSLNFACVLVPRLPQHYLIGDPAERLPDMMGQICLVFGWRLEHIAVQPDYLQWIVSAPPATSPSYLMRILRQQTSQRLFTAFPGLAQENPSGDFWAPGYLIMSSHQPPPPQVVKEFVQTTRKYQGI